METNKNTKEVICPTCGESVARATKEGQNKNKALWPLLPRLTAVLPPQGREMNNGFTLIELLVVVLIIGILAAVAVPQYQVAVKKAELTRYIALVDALYKAEQTYYLSHGEYADNLDKLDINVPVTSECIRKTVAGDKDRYQCNNKTWQVGISDYVTNVQAGSTQLLYVKFLQDYENTYINNYVHKKGGAYCFAKNNIDKKACQALGGQEIGASDYFAYYLLP